MNTITIKLIEKATGEVARSFKNISEDKAEFIFESLMSRYDINDYNIEQS